MNLLGTDYNGCLEIRSLYFTSSVFTFLLEYLAPRDCRGTELASETDLGGATPLQLRGWFRGKDFKEEIVRLPPQNYAMVLWRHFLKI